MSKNISVFAFVDGIICPPDWNMDNLFAKNWWGAVTPLVPSICSYGSETSAGGAPYDVNGGYFVNAPDLN